MGIYMALLGLGHFIGLAIGGIFRALAFNGLVLGTVILAVAGLLAVARRAVVRLPSVRPPRVLTVPFERGMTVGPPGDALTQRAVLEQALALLQEAQTPGAVREGTPQARRNVRSNMARAGAGGS